MGLVRLLVLAALLPSPTAALAARFSLAVPEPLAATRATVPAHMVIKTTKAERLVRKQLNPNSNIDNMTERQLKKYAYAMQIEVQRLLKEEQVSRELLFEMRVLLDKLDDRPEELALDDTIDVPDLIAAMKLEGLVRYGLPYATARTSWEKVRKAHPEFADCDDKDLFAAFQASGRGISSTFGELF